MHQPGKKVSLAFQPAGAFFVVFVRPLLCHWVISSHLLPSRLINKQSGTEVILLNAEIPKPLFKGQHQN